LHAHQSGTDRFEIILGSTRPEKDIPNLIIELEAEMRKAADQLEFERAIALRDKVRKLRERIEIDEN
jgi:excinuclease UvrABC helicase subunit UvrB